jgi:hypothetical protein
MTSEIHLLRKRCRCNGMTGLDAGLLGALCAQREYQRSALACPLQSAHTRARAGSPEMSVAA